MPGLVPGWCQVAQRQRPPAGMIASPAGKGAYRAEASVLGATGAGEVGQIFWFDRHTRLVIVIVLLSALLNTIL